MRLIDISVPISDGMVTYPGDPAVTVERVAAIGHDSPANVSKIEAGLHSGTHVDAPVHFIDGAAGVDQVPLDALVGPCLVVAVPGLDAATVAGSFDRAERVLFKTPNSELWTRDSFAHDAISLDGAAARVLVERGVRLVGIDYLSVGDEEAHRVLLGAGVVPVEGLDLRGVEPGPYELLCLPLKVVDADGAPARAVLVSR